MKIKILLLSILLPITAIGQGPALRIRKAIGGSGSDVANGVCPTSDGGCIIAGNSVSSDGDVITGFPGTANVLISKLGDLGQLQWTRTYGGSGIDWADHIQQTPDGGYIFIGATTSPDGDVSGFHGDSLNQAFDFWVVKLDASGAIQWQRSLGGSADELAQQVTLSSDGGYVIAGYTSSHFSGDVGANKGNSDCWIVKLDNAGNLLWQKTLGGTGIDGAFAVDKTFDGGYVVAGQSFSADGDVGGHFGPLSNADVWLVKLDSLGDITWERNYGGGNHDAAVAVRQTNDGGFIFAGNTNSQNGQVSGLHLGANPVTGNFTEDYWIVKTNAQGDIQWQRCLGGSGSDQGEDVILTPDGGYLAAGTSFSMDGDVTDHHTSSLPNTVTAEFWLAKLSSTGELQWAKSLGGSHHDRAAAITVRADSAYVVAGTTWSDDGDVMGFHPSGPVVLSDAWVAVLDKDRPTGMYDPGSAGAVTLYPNPARERIIAKGNKQVLDYSVSDYTGRVLLSGRMDTAKQEISVLQLKPGFYYVTLKTAEGATHVYPFVKQ